MYIYIYFPVYTCIKAGSLSLYYLGAMAALDKSTGTMFDLKNHINTRNVIKMQDNQVREVHEWATKNLNGMDNVSKT